MNTPRLQAYFTVQILLSLVLGHREAEATVVGGLVTGGVSVSRGGVFQKLHPPLPSRTGAPNTVGKDTFNDANLYAFDEGQNIVLGPEAFPLDIVPTNRPKVLPGGSVVSSHFVFFDPSNGDVVGHIDFDADIIGVLENVEHQTATDPLVRTDVIYLDPKLRGIETAHDEVRIDPENPRRLLVEFHASSPGDYVRVLTGPSKPLPPRILVPAQSDLWTAGLPFGTTNAIGSRVPHESAVEVLTIPVRTGSYLTFKTEGQVTLPSEIGGDTVGPSGSPSRTLERPSEGKRTLSGCTAPAGALIGVFLGHSEPTEGLTPASLDFTQKTLRDASNLLPRLKQVFTIGDGLDPQGNPLKAYVPVEATRLFLGVMSSTNQAAYTGSFLVEVLSQPNALLATRRDNRHQIELCWEPVHGGTVQIESAEDPVLGPWKPEGPTLLGDGETRCLTLDKPPGVRLFYRLSIRL
ncbi:MAG: hypothetical protein IT581_08805 [Verrucomicrobiales bacterium]|nr:hypothetical protein [Verrucomicrobiales bacterium]